MFSELFFRFGGFLDTINNYIQFIIVIFTITATLFYFMLPYIRPLRAILGDLGLRFREIIRVLWLCYKNPRKYIRIYIELAIIKTKGAHQDKKWWRNFRSVFKKFIDDNENSNEFTLCVDTSFDLATTEFTEKVKAYFDYFKRERIARRFGIPANEAISFICHVEIDEGYIVPITFITGLNDRYDEDWVKILSNFFTAFGSDSPPDTCILPEELYFTYNWLMWGPSYQNKYNYDKYKLIQYGFGDESNSVNIILDNSERSTDLWNMFCHEAEVSGEKKFGYNCSVKGKLLDTSNYYKYMYDKIDMRTVPFLKRLSAEQLGIPFLLELSNFDIKKSHKAENYFFSAYLWIMFGLIDKENPGFTPRKSVTFFEHANLADVNNYNFLAESLIDKCFRHFTYIANHDVYKNRKYHLCLSMNTYIEKLFLSKYEEMKAGEYGKWFCENLSTEMPFSISEILDTFDNYFVTQADEIEFIDVKIHDKASVKHLCNYYAEIYLPEFKNQTKYLSLDDMFMFMNNKQKKNYSFQISLATGSEKEVLGGIVAIYFPELNCGYIDSICVHENHRSNNIGKRLLLNAIQTMRQVAIIYENNTLDYIYAALPNKIEGRHDFNYFRFWENNGFVNTGFIHDNNIWICYNLKESIKALPEKKETEEIIGNIISQILLSDKI